MRFRHRKTHNSVVYKHRSDACYVQQMGSPGIGVIGEVEVSGMKFIQAADVPFYDLNVLSQGAEKYRQPGSLRNHIRSVVEDPYCKVMHLKNDRIVTASSEIDFH